MNIMRDIIMGFGLVTVFFLVICAAIVMFENAGQARRQAALRKVQPRNDRSIRFWNGHRWEDYEPKSNRLDD